MGHPIARFTLGLMLLLLAVRAGVLAATPREAQGWLLIITYGLQAAAAVAAAFAFWTDRTWVIAMLWVFTGLNLVAALGERSIGRPIEVARTVPGILFVVWLSFMISATRAKHASGTEPDATRWGRRRRAR